MMFIVNYDVLVAFDEFAVLLSINSSLYGIDE